MSMSDLAELLGASPCLDTGNDLPLFAHRRISSIKRKGEDASRL